MRIIPSKIYKTKKEGKGLVMRVSSCACTHYYNSKWREEGPEMIKQKVALEKKKVIRYSGIEF